MSEHMDTDAQWFATGAAAALVLIGAIVLIGALLLAAGAQAGAKPQWRLTCAGRSVTADDVKTEGPDLFHRLAGQDWRRARGDDCRIQKIEREENAE